MSSRNFGHLFASATETKMTCRFGVSCCFALFDVTRRRGCRCGAGDAVIESPVCSFSAGQLLSGEAAETRGAGQTQRERVWRMFKGFGPISSWHNHVFVCIVRHLRNVGAPGINHRPVPDLNMEHQRFRAYVPISMRLLPQSRPHMCVFPLFLHLCLHQSIPSTSAHLMPEKRTPNGSIETKSKRTNEKCLFSREKTIRF